MKYLNSAWGKADVRETISVEDDATLLKYLPDFIEEAEIYQDELAGEDSRIYDELEAARQKLIQIQQDIADLKENAKGHDE